jgi:hypothetical protein
VNIILGTSTAGGAINVNTAFTGFSTILLQATGNITFNNSTAWNLSTSTGQTAGQLTLEAGGDITFGTNAKILDANNWSVTLDAGYNFGNNTINSGVGNIYLNGGIGGAVNGTITTAAGGINLLAGQSVLVGSGSVYSTAGGSIYAYAMAGNIDAGTSNGSNDKNGRPADYNFDDTGATPNTAGLGGISTLAGGLEAVARCFRDLWFGQCDRHRGQSDQRKLHAGQRRRHHACGRASAKRAGRRVAEPRRESRRLRLNASESGNRRDPGAKSQRQHWRCPRCGPGQQLGDLEFNCRLLECLGGEQYFSEGGE